jgi:hypothetical protein
MSFNSSGGYLVEDLTLVIEAGSNDGNEWFSPFVPMVDINTNIASGAHYELLGGVLDNVTLVQNGFVSLVGPNHDVLKGVNVAASTPDVTVLGGTYSSPGYEPPTDLSGATGLVSGGANTIVDGFQSTGTTDGWPLLGAHGPYGNLTVESGVVRNCVADAIRYDPATVALENNTVTQLLPYTPCVPGVGECDGNLYNGCETDTTSNPLHCGTCNHSCGAGTCVGGVCQ